MAGLVPAIHGLSVGALKDVDARDKPGHDRNRAYYRWVGAGLVGSANQLKSAPAKVDRL
jgi:hypothetical protein